MLLKSRLFLESRYSLTSPLQQYLKSKFYKTYQYLLIFICFSISKAYQSFIQPEPYAPMIQCPREKRAQAAPFCVCLLPDLHKDVSFTCRLITAVSFIPTREKRAICEILQERDCPCSLNFINLSL